MTLRDSVKWIDPGYVYLWQSESFSENVDVSFLSTSGALLDQRNLTLGPNATEIIQPGTEGDPLQVSWGHISTLSPSVVSTPTYQLNLGGRELPEIGVLGTGLSRADCDGLVGFDRLDQKTSNGDFAVVAAKPLDNP